MRILETIDMICNVTIGFIMFWVLLPIWIGYLIAEETYLYKSLEVIQ